MRTSKVSETIRHYFKNTTLHGFKYLCSVHSFDRIGWLVCCCASACCAGLLCFVLWARFLQVPALLAVSDDIRTATYVKDSVPTVAVCAPPESVVDMFLEKLSINSSQAKQIPMTLARLLTGKSTAKDQLVLIDEILAAHNLTLAQVMMNFTLGCDAYTRRCRYQKKALPCRQLFEKELTYWGMCCVMRADKLPHMQTGLLGQPHSTQLLELVLQCAHGSALYGCQLVTYYQGEEWLEPDNLIAGYYYTAQLRFTTILENENSLVEKACVHDGNYSRVMCMRRCAEKECGCRDPLLYQYRSTKSELPPCPATRLGCLRAYEFKNYNNISCQCLPTCKKITTYMVLEPSPITNIQHVIDPLYYGLNITPTIVLTLRVNVGHSRVFILNPTETWLTLLSSLGGVFNMFLGVGLFSVLEFLYFLIAKLPVSIRQSSEIDPTAMSRYTTSRHVR